MITIIVQKIECLENIIPNLTIMNKMNFNCDFDRSLDQKNKKLFS